MSDHYFCESNACSLFTDARKKYQSFTLQAHNICKDAIEKPTVCLGHCETTSLEKHKCSKDAEAGATSLSFKLLLRFLSWACSYLTCWVCISFWPPALHQFCSLEQTFKSSQLLSQPPYSPWRWKAVNASVEIECFHSVLHGGCIETAEQWKNKPREHLNNLLLLPIAVDLILWWFSL